MKSQAPIDQVRQTAVPPLVKILYGVGGIGITIVMIVFGLFILFFYNSVMGLSATLVGVASAIGLALDAIFDPYIGYRSDMSQSRRGRRHPFMLVGALTTGLCFWLLLSPPQGWGTLGLFAWLLVTTILIRVASAVFRIPYLSLGAELAQDYHERTYIVAIRSFFGLCGTLGAASLSFLLFFPDTGQGDPKLNYAGYPQMGMVLGAALTVACLVSVVGTYRYRFQVTPVISQRVRSVRDFLQGFVMALRNPCFRTVWLSDSLFFLAVTLNAVLAIHFYTWYVDIHDSATLSRIQFLFYASAVVGVLAWMPLSKRAEKKGLYLLSVVTVGGLMVAATVLFGEGSVLGTGNPVPLYIGNALAGFFASGLWVIPGSMLADVADADELDTKERREGIFFGLINFGEKVAGGIAILLGGLLLDNFVHLQPGAEQDALASSRIGLLFGILPASLLGVAALVILPYTLNRRRVGEIQLEIQLRRSGTPETATES